MEKELKELSIVTDDEKLVIKVYRFCKEHYEFLIGFFLGIILGVVLS